MEYVITLLAAIISSGLVVKFIEDFRKQRELLAVIKALKVECIFNTQHRNPFKFEWLIKAISLLEFSEQCPELAERGLNVLELGHDANNGQIQKRKNDDGGSLQPADVQNFIKELIVGIDVRLPELEQRSKIMGYIWWCFLSLMGKK